MPTISESLAIALTHHRAGRLDLAEQIYRRILDAVPEHVDALHLLGVAFYQQGKHQLAVEYIGRAIALKPNEAAFHANLGNALKDLGRLEAAIAAYRRALTLKPDYAEAHNNLGNTLLEQGKLAEAVAAYQRALQLNPRYAEGHNNLGNALKDLGRFDEAVASYRRALELKPDYPKAYSNLGDVFKLLGKLDDAVACCRRAIELKPDYAEAHNNLGNALRDQGKFDEAVACYGRAIELMPGLAESHNNLGNALTDLGRLSAAVAAYRQALRLKPDYARAHGNLLNALQYRPGTTLAELAEAHAEYDRRHNQPLRTVRQYANVRDPDRPLRVGLVSPDFGRHPVGFFLIRCLENLDRSQVEVVCYNDRFVEDELTARFRSAAASWRPAHGASDLQLTEQILADRIDVLFDLTGYTAYNRLLVFARKPAPIQITWAGYVGTTGMEAMDYLLADRQEIPPEAETHYRERVLRMPDGYVCYDPPAYAPTVAPLPALAGGHVTFGSFNNPTKLNPPLLQTWARILHRVPQSRLVLKFKGMDDPALARDILGQFAAQGIDATRIECLGWSPHAASLAEYGRVDLALDPLPYSGGLTTCESLWMGVPVITCPGETFAGRHALSHLTSVGLTETIAGDLDEYVALAVKLAMDLPRLALLRAGLRTQMAQSPLCDGPRFAANWTRLLRGVWRDWCGV